MGLQFSGLTTTSQQEELRTPNRRHLHRHLRFSVEQQEYRVAQHRQPFILEMGNLLGTPVTEKETHIGNTEDGLEYAVSSMQGWRVHMEDAHILEPELYAEECSQKPEEQPTRIDLPGHALFAVFDGHGGKFSALYAGSNLCRVLRRQPKFVAYAKFVQERPQKELLLQGSAERSHYIRSGLELLEGALLDAFVDMDREILSTMKGDLIPDSTMPLLADGQAKSNQDGVTDMNESSDGEEGESSTPTPPPRNLSQDESGTTAVVVVMTPTWIVCANAGDSRAVASKNGSKAVPLSYDHKPDDEEEERRIRAAGGYVAGGRVHGDLAVSRGFGDFRFKDDNTVLAGAAGWNKGNTAETYDQKEANRTMLQPDDQKVSPIPDIITHNRSAKQDEFIIIACDGIWDVQTNQECVKSIAQMFEEGESNLGLICEEVSEKEWLLCLLWASV